MSKKKADEVIVDTELTTEIVTIDEQTIRDKIYEVRGVKVMLDFELAEIYGYTTSAFNQQVKRNDIKFPPDFRFLLTEEDLQNLLSQNVTASWGGDRRTELWAFTESGVYMLMSVLKGELATKQSIALIRVFQSMKNYIFDNQGLVSQRDILRLAMKTNDNSEAIREIRSRIEDQQKLLLEHDDKLVDAFERINDTLKRSDISPVLLQFNLPEDRQEVLLREGHPVNADIIYMDIYSQAKKSVYVIDNYINIKTLQLLQNVKPGVTVTVFSDNLYNKLHASDYTDFQVEFPSIPISFITTGGIMHDRFIVLDYEEPDERFFHCGGSSKDAAVKNTTMITELTSEDIKPHMHSLIDQMKGNQPLVLK